MTYQRTDFTQRETIRRLGREQLATLQFQKLNGLLAEVLPSNQFYAAKLERHSSPLASLGEFSSWPLTTKDELLENASAAGFAANLTYPLDQYCRLHRTSGSRGRPLIVLDTVADWQWWMESWQYVLDSVRLSSADRIMMAFSFGPFIGFWSAFDAVVERGCMTAPTGSLSTLARLELLRTMNATVVFCTPSYALHMAEVAENHGIALADLSVRAIVVAGEPGGSVPAIRKQIETGWQAEVVDHSGASEVGPWGIATPSGQGLFVNEAQFIAEFLTLDSQRPAEAGQLSELVLTTLGRAGSPVIRYRTGDLVRPRWEHHHDCRFVWLEGGVLGRTDDMMIIRGVNVFPTAIEQILRCFPEVVEYRLIAFKQAALDQLKIEIEDRIEQPQRIMQAIQVQLGLRVEVTCVPLGSLPRFEAKGKRFIDQRTNR